MHEAHFLTQFETALQMAPCHLCWEVPWTCILQQCHREKPCLDQLLHWQREEGPLSACCSSGVATMEGSTVSISHALWHCSPFLDTCFPAEKHHQNQQKQQRFADCKRITGKLVLYLELKATVSCLHGSAPSQVLSGLQGLGEWKNAGFTNGD